jgi:hypothetical protein
VDKRLEKDGRKGEGGREGEREREERGKGEGKSLSTRYAPFTNSPS